MKFSFALPALLCIASSASGFAPSSTFMGQTATSARTTTSRTPSRPTSLQMALSEGDRIMLIGPGFLQLNVAKAAKAAGLRPMVIADKKKLETFRKYTNDDALMDDSTYGMPEVGEPGFGEIKAVVFCSEEPILGPSIIPSVLDYMDKGKSIFNGPNGAPDRVVLCCPLTGGSGKMKSMTFMPIINTGKDDDKKWKSFVDAYKKHPIGSGPTSSIIRFGSLLGGGTDGPELLANLGVDESFYKMSLEQYRDLKERAFDRFRIGVQVLPGNTINPMPPNQEKLEKEGIPKEEWRESFRVLEGYPQEDRANRHSVAQAVVQSLMRDVDGTKPGTVPAEITVLSKSNQEFPTAQEWDDMFANPGPANWPDPFAFDAAKFGLE